MNTKKMSKQIQKMTKYEKILYKTNKNHHIWKNNKDFTIYDGCNYKDFFILSA